MHDFDHEVLVRECLTSLEEGPVALKEALSRVAASGTGVIDALARFRDRGGVLHHSPGLTVLAIEWPPGMYDPPHDHGMTAAITMLVGQEHHSLFRTGAGEGLAASGDKVVSEGDVLVLGDDAVHAVRNPRSTWSLALHVYAGDFFNAPRREWDADGLRGRSLDIDDLIRRYATAVESAPPSPWTSGSAG